MVRGLLAAVITAAMTAGRLPPAAVAAAAAAAFALLFLPLHHRHDNWTAIDYYAHESRLHSVPAGLKGLLTLAMIVLWTGAVFLHKYGFPPKACFIAALPATFMSAVSVTYFFQAPECLHLPVSIAYPVGIVVAVLFLLIFVWRILILQKNDVLNPAQAK